MTYAAQETTASADGWPEAPLPLADLPAVLPLPEELVPGALRPWILDAAERLQVPPEMIAAPAIVTAGSLIGRALGVHPKQHDDWLVLANLWGMIVGPPGVQKTPAMQEATRHVRRLAHAASQRHADAERDAAIERKLIAARAKAVEAAAAKRGADRDACRADLETLRDELAKWQPVERRYLTQDPTTEKLGELLVANPRGMLVLRDELAGWLRTLERPGREGDREFFLEAWNGTGSYTYDRIGRGTVHIPALSVSVFGTTQPAKLARLLVDHARDGTGDDGLVQRFGVAIWPDVPRTWRNVDRWPETAARDRAWRAYQAITDDKLAARVGASAEREGDIPALRLAPAALELLTEYRSELEHRLRSGELDAWPAYAAHQAKYRSLVPAIALVTYLLDVVTGAEPGAVTLEAVRVGAAWGEYLEAHARRIYGVDLEPGRAAGRLLAQRIVEGDVLDGDTVRVVHQAGWSGLTDRDGVRAALTYLAGLRWLRVEERQTGGRPSKVIRLHPGIIRRQPTPEDPT